MFFVLSPPSLLLADAGATKLAVTARIAIKAMEYFMI
jgi:hypothetical protein